MQSPSRLQVHVADSVSRLVTPSDKNRETRSTVARKFAASLLRIQSSGENVGSFRNCWFVEASDICSS